MTTAIEFNHVTKRFPNSSYPALNDINLAIEEGDFVTIVGTSGCGKTTLIKHVNRLQEADSGDIKIFGQDIYALEVTDLRKKNRVCHSTNWSFPSYDHLPKYCNCSETFRMG